MPYNPDNPLSASNRILLEIEKNPVDAKKVSQILNNVSISYSTKILYGLLNRGLIYRTKISVQKKGGAYFEYSISQSGIKKCDYLRGKGLV